jgi:hypothetical protein
MHSLFALFYENILIDTLTLQALDEPRFGSALDRHLSGTPLRTSTSSARYPRYPNKLGHTNRQPCKILRFSALQLV